MLPRQTRGLQESEQQPEPQLNRPWTTPAQHLAKLRCADGHAGTSSQAEYGMVENIEELGPKLDLIALRNRLVPDEGHIEILTAIIAQARLSP